VVFLKKEKKKDIDKYFLFKQKEKKPKEKRKKIFQTIEKDESEYVTLGSCSLCEFFFDIKIF